MPKFAAKQHGQRFRAMAIPLAVTLAALGFIAVVTAQTAGAYAFTGLKWKGGAVTRTYCAKSSVTGHSNWSNLIDKDVAQYNALKVKNQPQWKAGCGGEVIRFVQIKLDAGVCGNTSWTSDSTNAMISAQVEYSSKKTYYDSAVTKTSADTCSFQTITLHEFGHSQGLAHSTVTTAVMWPTDNNKRTLQTDDKNGIKALYK